MAVDEKEAGMRVFLRIQLASIWEEVLFRGTDPRGDMERRRTLQFESMDALLEKYGGDDLTKHAALHEMEILWSAVRERLEARISQGR